MDSIATSTEPARSARTVTQAWDCAAPVAVAMLPTALPAPQAAAARRSATVLHIEENPGAAASMALLLRLEGYEVITAASHREAHQHLTDRALRPDFILCDYRLPMGQTAAQLLAELAPLLPVKHATILLTDDLAGKCLENAQAIADRVLPKPVDADLLLRHMMQLLRP